jgi:hypothetical protein
MAPRALAWGLAAATGAALGVGTALLAFPTGSGPAPNPPRAWVRSSPPAPRERPPSAPPEIPTFPSVVVRVVGPGHDEEPVEALVYAVPAGHAGTDEPGDLVRADTDRHGVARLHVLAPGAYDVGAVRGSRHALVRDVTLDGASARAAPVVLRLPSTREVEVALDPAVVRRLVRSPLRHPDVVRLRLARAGGGRPATYPGRDEQRPVEVVLWSAGPRGSVSLPAGRWRLLDADARLPVAVEPREFEAPANVRVVADGCELAARIRLDPDAARLGPGARLTLHLRAAGVALALDPLEVGPDEPRRTIDVTRSWPVRARAGMLSWTGEGVRPGSVPFEARDERADVRLDLEPDPDRPPRAAVERRFRIVSDEAAAPPDVRVLAFDRDGRAPASLRWDLDRGEGLAVVAECDRFVAVGGQERVSDVLAFANAEEGSTLRVRRGGFLVLSPDRVLPEGVSVHVTAADGGLLPTSAHPSGWDDAVRHEVRPGTVLGPFVPGPVRLRVHGGGHHLGEVVATVRAGENVLVAIPTSPPPR